MNQDDAKAAYIRDWMSLPFSERRTDAQAAAFAMKVKDLYPFKSSADRYQVIKGWLQYHLSRSPDSP